MSPAGRLVVFAGPSLLPVDREGSDDIDWRPPAVAGDALRLLAQPPRAVLLVDGGFDQVPAIRHKELLMLMARNVTLIGAASMGALRAVELAPFGMSGVGRVFEAYRSDRLRGDDEVALLHAPGELDWAPLTVPLVNVRATLHAALRGRIIKAPAGRALMRAAADIAYQDRLWPEVVERACADAPAERDAIARFAAWRPEGEVDQKRLDALAGLAVARAACPAPVWPPRPPPPRTVFTEMLYAYVKRIDAEDRGPPIVGSAQRRP